MVKDIRNATIHNGTATSKAAAESIRPKAPALRQQVADYLRRQSTRGATDKEIQAALNIRGDTQRPRRRELQQAGMIAAAEETRDGCKVWVWLTEANRRDTAQPEDKPTEDKPTETHDTENAGRQVAACRPTQSQLPFQEETH